MGKIMERESSWWEEKGDNYGKGKLLVGGQWQRLWQGKVVGGTMATIMARESSWWEDNGEVHRKGKKMVEGQWRRLWQGKAVDG